MLTPKLEIKFKAAECRVQRLIDMKCASAYSEIIEKEANSGNKIFLQLIADVMRPYIY